MLRHEAWVGQDAGGSAELAKGIQDSWKERVARCGGLNILGPGSDTIRCGLVRENVSLWAGL